MNLNITRNADQQIRRLPIPIQKKTQKAFRLLIVNSRHPSLHARKKRGSDDYEARIDYHYRFTYHIEGEHIYILTVGSHDIGLGLS